IYQPSNMKAQSHMLIINENPLDIKYPQKIDSLMLKDYLSRFKNRYMAAGYPTCNIDSIVWKSNKVQVYFYPGSRYRIGNIAISSDSSSRPFNYLQNRYKENVFDTLSNYNIAEDALVYL